MTGNDLIRWMFFENVWLWLHIFAGGVVARLLLWWGIWQPVTAILIVFGFAVWWELLELVYGNIKEKYGSRTHFFADAAGDILGAVAMAVIVVI